MGVVLLSEPAILLVGMIYKMNQLFISLIEKFASYLKVIVDQSKSPIPNIDLYAHWYGDFQFPYNLRNFDTHLKLWAINCHFVKGKR
jgi:hypothetical protein